MEAINESNVSYGSIYGLRFGWVVGNFIQSYLYDTEFFSVFLPVTDRKRLFGYERSITAFLFDRYMKKV